MNTLIRFIWFIFIGWWAAIIWFFLSLSMCITIILFPFGAYMLSKTWTIMTLSKNPKEIKVNIQNNISQINK